MAASAQAISGQTAEQTNWSPTAKVSIRALAGAAEMRSPEGQMGSALRAAESGRPQRA